MTAQSSIKESLSSLLQHHASSNHIDIVKCISFIPQISAKNTSLNRRELKKCSVYLCQIISKCHTMNDLKRIHSCIDQDILQYDIYINTALIKMYGKYSSIDQAINVYNSIDNELKDVKIVRTIMRTLINYRHSNSALSALSIYNEFNHFSDDTLNILAIKACAHCNNFQKGKQIISQTNMKQKHYHLHSKTALIDFYGNSCDINDALDVFKSIEPQQMNVFILSAMIKAYINNGYFIKSLQIYDQYNMLNDDLCHLLAIKACTNSNNLDKGKEIHSKINLKNSKYKIEISNALIEFYGHFKDIDNVYNIFNLLHRNKRNNVIISTMMKVFIGNNYNEQALSLYDEYKSNNDILHLLAIKACINSNLYEYGKQIHDRITDKTQSVQLKATLIEFYGHFNDIDNAINIFDSINYTEKTAVTVAAIMTALNCNDKALEIYHKFDSLNDDICHNLAIKCCINTDNFERGKQIHSKLARNIGNIRLKNVLISFYGHFEDIQSALNIFNSMNNDKKDIIGISAMMNAYYNVNMNEECMKLFKNIKKINNALKPDVITYGIVLKACTQSTQYHFGQYIHQQLEPSMLNNLSIQINLINMYGKCGMIYQCQQIFETSQHKNSNIDIWNVMIYAFGRNGDIQKAKILYDEMKDIGLKADVQTYKILINGCNHCGDVIMAKYIWNNEINDDMKYNVFVINSLIDCLCRKGMLFEAKQILLKFNPNDERAWTSFLNGHILNAISLDSQDTKNFYQHIEKTFGHETDAMRLYRQLICN